MFKSIVDWYMGALETGGYPLIVLLMAMESSIVPLPSEVVIPPAAYLAQGRSAVPFDGANASPVGRVISLQFRKRW